MEMVYFKRACLILMGIIACSGLPCANDVILAQEDDKALPTESTGIQSPDSDGKGSIRGYPVKMRRIGTPMDVEWDLDNSFPKSGSLLELILECDESQLQEDKDNDGDSKSLQNSR